MQASEQVGYKYLAARRVLVCVSFVPDNQHGCPRVLSFRPPLLEPSRLIASSHTLSLFHTHTHTHTTSALVCSLERVQRCHSDAAWPPRLVESHRGLVESGRAQTKDAEERRYRGAKRQRGTKRRTHTLGPKKRSDHLLRNRPSSVSERDSQPSRLPQVATSCCSCSCCCCSLFTHTKKTVVVVLATNKYPSHPAATHTDTQTHTGKRRRRASRRASVQIHPDARDSTKRRQAAALAALEVA